MKNQSVFIRYLALFLGCIVIWVSTAIIVPLINNHLPVIKKLAYASENNNINPGAFWYMDVGINDDASIFITGSIAPHSLHKQ